MSLIELDTIVPFLCYAITFMKKISISIVSSAAISQYQSFDSFLSIENDPIISVQLKRSPFSTLIVHMLSVSGNIRSIFLYGVAHLVTLLVFSTCTVCTGPLLDNDRLETRQNH